MSVRAFAGILARELLGGRIEPEVRDDLLSDDVVLEQGDVRGHVARRIVVRVGDACRALTLRGVLGRYHQV